ncbi:hypothetical protein BH23GEM8_BH23GEM8_23710 [soil metagenome]
MMKRTFLAAVLTACLVSPASAQDEGLAGICSLPEVPASARDYCVITAQALTSAQPQLGILLAGGNPTLGTAGAGGLRLGVLPRVNATAKVNLVLVRLPDILIEELRGGVRDLSRTTGLLAPALSGTVSVGVFPGIDATPLVGGIGAIDLLGSATWLPLRLAGISGIGANSANTSLGGGVRVGLLRESFQVPGVSASVVYRRLGQVAYGEVCRGPTQPETRRAGNATLEYGRCPVDNDPAEFAFDLANWSTRLAASKRVLGFGLTGGIGYDEFSSDIGFGFQEPDETSDFYARVRDADLRSSRWSAFVNGSYTLLVATLAAEGGWMQGSNPVSGFAATANEFDPSRGTFFGSLGLRLAF